MKRQTLLNAIHFLQKVVVRGDDEQLLIQTVDELQAEVNKRAKGNHREVVEG
jgi:hypothetical protein